MHIHIHLIGRHFEKQKRDGIAAGHEQAAIGFLKRMAQTAIANPAAIEKQILQLGVAAIAGRVGDEAAQPRRAAARESSYSRFAHLGTEEQRRCDPAAPPSPGLRKPVCRCASASDAHAGIAHSARRVNVSQMWPSSVEMRLQELVANRRIEEEMSDFDAACRRTVPRANRRQIAAVADEFGTDRLARRPRLQQ